MQFLGPPVHAGGGYKPPPQFLGPPVQQQSAIAALLAALHPQATAAVDPAIATAMAAQPAPAQPRVDFSAVRAMNNELQQRQAALALLHQMGAGYPSAPQFLGPPTQGNTPPHWLGPPVRQTPHQGWHPYVPPTY